MMPVSLITFELPHGTHKLCGDSYTIASNVIVLHGAGESSRGVFSRLRRYLNDHTIDSVSFDFIGHGETGGDIKDTTLHDRTNQAAAVIRHTCIEPVTVIAASMGAYSAIKLTELFSVDNLILLVPAVYTPQAYDISFGPKFSAVIRVPYSWKDSDAFNILSGFNGNLIVIAAQFDDVIPIETIEQIHASAVNARSRFIHVVPGSRHLSLFPREEDFKITMDLIIGVLLKGGNTKGV